MSIQAEIIKNLQPFRGLPHEFISEFAEVCVPRKFSKDEIIYSHGEESGRVFLLLSGEVSLYQSLEGRKAALQTFKAGDFFGDLSFAHPSPFQMANFAQARESAQACVVLGRDMVGLVNKFHQFALFLLTALRNRLHHAESKIRDLAVAPAETRILNELIRHAINHGMEIEGRRQIEERLTHQTLAEMTGLTRETVTKTLKLLENNDFISYTPDKMFRLHIKKIIEDCLGCLKLAGGMAVQ